MTSQDYLEWYLNPLPEFGGVYNGTNITEFTPLSYPCGIIVNLDDEDEAGSHWVSLYFKRRSVIYFDSFGRSCSKLTILYKLQRLGYTKYFYNTKPIQHILSSFCGYFAMGFILSGVAGLTLPGFLDLFKLSSLDNDAQIVKCLNLWSSRYLTEYKQ